MIIHPLRPVGHIVIFSPQVLLTKLSGNFRPSTSHMCNKKGWLPVVLDQYRGLQKFSAPPKNTLISKEENKESRIDIDPEYSSDSFCHIYKLLGHHYKMEKEKGDIACDPK